MSDLPNKEEFIKKFKFDEDKAMEYWNKDLYKCPICNGGVKRDYSVAYMTNPPKYRYFCRNCSYSDIF